MALNEEKFKQMQDEMSRFEEEIGLPIPDLPIGGPGRRIIGANTYNEAKKTLAGHPTRIGLPMGIIPPPPPPPPMPFIPAQVRGMPPMDCPRGPMDGPMPFNGGLFRGQLPPPPPMPPHMGPGGPMPPSMGGPGPMPPGFGMMGPMGPGPMPQPMMSGPPNYPGPPPPQNFQRSEFMSSQRYARDVPPSSQDVKLPQPASTVLSATPMMYVANPQLEIAAMQAETTNHQSHSPLEMLDEPKKLLHHHKKKISQPATETVFTPTQVSNTSKKKEKKNKKLIRTAGGQTWEDSTLGEWEDDDFRLFCGDLGNDVTDEVLTRAFSKYPSFLKSKVVRDKRTNKTKGFGFVSFKDPQDFIRATKEMNGRYVGSRPIKLRKSSWRNRSLDVVRKKDKEKTVLINMLTGR